MYLLSNDEWCQFWWYFSFLSRWCWLGLAAGQVDIVIHNEYGVSISSPYQGPRHFPPSGLPWPASLEKTAVCRVRGGVSGPSWSLCAMFLMSIKKGKIESSRTDVPDFVSDFGSRSRCLDRSRKVVPAAAAAADKLPCLVTVMRGGRRGSVQLIMRPRHGQRVSRDW